MSASCRVAGPPKRHVVRRHADKSGKCRECRPDTSSNSVVRTMPDDTTCRVGTTCWQILLDIKKKRKALLTIAPKWCDLVRESRKNGIVYDNSRIRTIFSENTAVTSVGVMAGRVVDMAGQSCGNTSADTWPSLESSHDVGNIVKSAVFSRHCWHRDDTCRHVGDISN